ncbi:MAG: type II secretion system minor pseudopilin GspJ [Pseudomonadota bacterium]|nr:type II secretion system minor pseudopilin GspJ [Pseudomonadota bacterium]
MRRPRGFTLLELLVAIAILALLAAFAYAGLNALLRHTEATQAALAPLRTLQQGVGQLERDLHQLAPRGVRDARGDPQPPLRVQGRSDLPLQLTQSGWLNPLAAPRAALQRVHYRLDGQRLERIAYAVLDQPPGTAAVASSSVLFEGVTRFEVAVFDADAQRWRNDWPPPAEGGAPSRPGLSAGEPLPRALRWRLELAGRDGTLERLVVLP